MESISSASRDVLLNQIRTIAAMIEAAGVAPSLVMKDIAQSAEFFASYAKEGGQNIIQAGIAARKLGLEMSAVASITDSLLDFETSIEKQMEAQVLLGRNLNLDKARQLAFTGDTVGLQNEILRQVGSEAEFNKMNYLQREALAGAIGLSVERMSALVRQEESAAAAGEKNYGTFAALGALLVGIAGAVIGALTLGTGVKASLKGAVKGGIGGIAIGGTMGLAAAAAGAKVPSLQTGRGEGHNVAETGFAKVHKGESVGTFDMKETNKLLRDILTQEEKTARNTSDMVVA